MTPIPPDRWLEAYIEALVSSTTGPSCWIEGQQGYEESRKARLVSPGGMKGAVASGPVYLHHTRREMKGRTFEYFNQAIQHHRGHSAARRPTGSPKKNSVRVVVWRTQRAQPVLLTFTTLGFCPALETSSTHIAYHPLTATSIGRSKRSTLVWFEVVRPVTTSRTANHQGK